MEIKQFKRVNIDSSLVEFLYTGKKTKIEGNERSLRDIFFKMKEISIHLYALYKW